MTHDVQPRPAGRPAANAVRPGAPRVVMADRGDPLVGPLSHALGERYDVTGHLDVDLSRAERLLVAACTVRTSRAAWSERFHKSNLGVGLRSRRARAGLDRTDADLVLQTHALFESVDPRTVLYLDCTHRQSMRHWPAWNPLRGRALRRWLDRETRQYHRAAHIFAFYGDTARSLVEEYGVSPDQVSVVGAAANFDHLPVTAPPPSGPPTVLFVGNDFERKGGCQLLEAWPQVRARVPDARLRVVGTTYSSAPVDGVEVLGRIQDRAHLSRLYTEAHAFCLPSFFDPFPGALLEAMAHARPSVVTRTSGIPDIVEDGVTALTIGRGGSMTAELAAALEQLLVDPPRAAEMGVAARRRAEDHFTWPLVVGRMAPVLDRLTATRPARPGHGEETP